MILFCSEKLLIASIRPVCSVPKHHAAEVEDEVQLFPATLQLNEQSVSNPSAALASVEAVTSQLRKAFQPNYVRGEDEP